MKDIVIIVGAGHAGIQTAASLRDYGFKGIIKIFDRDKELPYQKPPLSKTFLKSNFQTTPLLRSKDWYLKNNIELKLNREITRIDFENKVAIDNLDVSYEYNKLVVATGSINNKLGVNEKDINNSNIFSLRSLSDAKKIREKFSSIKNLLIIGAGFIGLEVASTAISLNKNVTIVEGTNQVMSRSISRFLSEWFINYYKNLGVNFIFNDTFKSFEKKNNDTLSLNLSSGKQIIADLILISAGSRPDDKLFKLFDQDNGENRIKVNQYLETKYNDIYAIGDCCFFDFLSETVRFESIQNAVDQAKLVALNLLNVNKKYSFTPWFWSDQFNVKLQIVGYFNQNDRSEIKTLGSLENSKFTNFIFNNEKLKSVETINNPGHHIILKNNYDKWEFLRKDMLEENFDFKKFFNSLS